MSRNTHRPISRHAALTLLGILLAAPGAGAQIPGLPVLQNAFSNPGVTAAANFGSSEGDRTIALAGAWAPASGRFQFSAGVGSYSPDEGDRATVFGARFAAALFSFGGGRFGVAPFIGVGGASVDEGRVTHVPVGVGAGWRGALGASRGISVHTAAFYNYGRFTPSSDSEAESRSHGLFRFSGGADVTIIRSLGLTVGVEGGVNAKAGDPGAGGIVFGGGLSYAFR